MQDGNSLIPRILVIRFSSLGDVVLAAPVFQAVKHRLPDAHITLLTKMEYTDIHRSNPLVDEVIGFDPVTRSLSSLFQMVRRGEFNEIIDLHGSVRSRLITLAGRTRSRRYRQERLRRFLMVLRPPFKRIRPITPVIDRYLATAGLKDPLVEQGIPVIHLTEEELERGKKLRRDVMADSEGQLIVLLPAARHAPKEWPLFRFAELAGLLSLGGDIPVVAA
ncbi:glycosyltransferase family 9 protein, partial [Candidatus Zixiibacteriota bacterium]